MASTTPTPFFKQLETKCREKNSLLCVGLDPHKSELPPLENLSLEQQAKHCEDFCSKLIDETHEHVSSYKPNSAFFEAFGEFGFAALRRVIARIHAVNCLCILDCKRGDIATTAEAYAEASYQVFDSDSVTLHPYMGWDSIEPFVRDKSKGCFVLVKTSNKSSNELQTLPSIGDGMLYEKVAQTCEAEWTMKNHCEGQIGMVVGATDSDALRRCRAQAPSLWILAPGVGFQGGDLSEAVKSGIRVSDGLGLLVPVSRGISRAKDPKQAAKELKEQLNATREQILGNIGGSPSKRAKQEDSSSIQDHQSKFFSLALRCGVLKFGSFTLKSGRKSPYFFNAGLFNTGSAMYELASCYAKSLQQSGVEFDVLFGPAYKGIPLASCVASQLYLEYKRDVPFCYNRKEEKDHGEGGLLVGAPVTTGTRVLILDDVITAGTAVREAVKIIQKQGGVVSGLIVAIDRQEVVTEGTKQSAVDAVKQEFGFPVISIVGLSHLLVYCEQEVNKISGGKQVLDDIKEYRSRYGVV